MRCPRFTSLVLTSALASIGSAQVPTWKPQHLGTPDPSWNTVAVTAVNDAGTVVGITYLSGYKRAWVASPSLGVELLPLPDGATWSGAADINSSGVITGQVLFGNDSRAILWRPGASGYEYFLLPAGPGGHVPFAASGLNDAGDVVGKLGILGASYYWNEAEGVVQLTYAQFPKVPADVNEQRQIVADTSRMDLDTLVLEELGNPTGTPYNYMYSVLGDINDAGECVGYAVTATSSSPYLPVRYSDGPQWKVFSNFPLNAAGALGISATGDTVYQIGIYGTYVYVNGVGSIAVGNTVDPAYSDWSLAGTFAPAISRGGLLACTGMNTATGQFGVVLLTPLYFENLGGAVRGALGDPVLSGYGSLQPGEPARLRLASAAPDSFALLAWSATSVPLPLFGGMLHANPASVLVALPTDALGKVDLSFDWPAVPPGTTFYQQFGVLDAEAEFGVSLSNGLRGETR